MTIIKNRIPNVFMCVYVCVCERLVVATAEILITIIITVTANRDYTIATVSASTIGVEVCLSPLR